MSVFTGKFHRGADLLQSGDNTQVMRILVVEDEERLARLISRVLVEEGYAVETEANGRQALMRALADDYDLLIVDWMLPELSGVQLVKRLRAAEFALLATLLQRPGQVFTRPVLLDTVWGASPEVYANVVDLYVSYLRKKLDGDGGTSHIRTVRGVGYTFEPQPGPR